jgi:hypothetical protein
MEGRRLRLFAVVESGNAEIGRRRREKGERGKTGFCSMTTKHPLAAAAAGRPGITSSSSFKSTMTTI